MRSEHKQRGAGRTSMRSDLGVSDAVNRVALCLLSWHVTHELVGKFCCLLSWHVTHELVGNRPTHSTHTQRLGSAPLSRPPASFRGKNTTSGYRAGVWVVVVIIPARPDDNCRLKLKRCFKTMLPVVCGGTFFFPLVLNAQSIAKDHP